MELPGEIDSPGLAVVMPVYNEALNIGGVVREWFGCLKAQTPDFAFFAINDGSTDESAEILAQLAREVGPRLNVVNKRNSGHGSSCREGYELALKGGAQWIFQIDSDGQCDPAFFSSFYHARETHDCIFGFRRTRDDGWGRVVVSRACRTALWAIAGTYVNDPNVPYRMISASALRAALRRIPVDFDLQNIALSFVLKRDGLFRWKDLPIHFRARQGGENSINYRKIAHMGINLLRDLRRIRGEHSHSGWRSRWAWRRLAS